MNRTPTETPSVPDSIANIASRIFGGTANNPLGGYRTSFQPACAKHDVCYGTCNSDRKACDEQWQGLMAAACQTAFPNDPEGVNGCEYFVYLYYNAVRVAGAVPHLQGQIKACTCCQ